jgi:hypothetical protein
MMAHLRTPAGGQPRSAWPNPSMLESGKGIRAWNGPVFFTGRRLTTMPNPHGYRTSGNSLQADCKGSRLYDLIFNQSMLL